MGKGISVIVGGAEGGDGQEVSVYRALRTLLCSSCGATIGEGTLFTRRECAADRGGGCPSPMPAARLRAAAGR